MKVRASDLDCHHLIDYDDVACYVLDLIRHGEHAVLVRVLPHSACADPILLHYWADEEVPVCGWTTGPDSV